MTSIGGKGEEDCENFITIDQQIYRFSRGKDAKRIYGVNRAVNRTIKI